MRICYFGHYFPAYPHNWIYQAALREAGHEVVEIRSDDPRVIRRWIGLIRQARNQEFDAMFVGWPGHTDVPLAWVLCRHRKVRFAFDAFVSLHEGYVEDRALFRPGGLRARVLRLADVVACKLADVVLLGTDAHIRYFREDLGAKGARFERVFVGADDRAMASSASALPGTADETVKVGLYASFLPLQGVGVVLEAAGLLHDEVGLTFHLAGRGHELPRLQPRIDALANLRYVGELPYAELVGFVDGLDICLGVFGDTPKTRRVIPNKVFDAMALGKPIITADTPAVREILTDNVDAILVPANDAEALAAAIVDLASDRPRREALGTAARRRFEETSSISALARELDAVVQRHLDGRRPPDG